MNIAIIDDISTDAEDLKNIAVFYFEKKQIQAEIYQFFSAEEFFEDYQPGKFQILFLDIYMNGMTGMEAARRIRRQSDDCILVFVTTSSDFAVESYDVGASYYLLKPFQPEKLCSILDSFQSRHLLDPVTLKSFLTGFPSGSLCAAFYMQTHSEMQCAFIPMPVRSVLILPFTNLRNRSGTALIFSPVTVTVSSIWIVYRKLLKKASFWTTGRSSRSGNVALLLSAKLIFSISLRQMKKYLSFKNAIFRLKIRKPSITCCNFHDRRSSDPLSGMLTRKKSCFISA